VGDSRSLQVRSQSSRCPGSGFTSINHRLVRHRRDSLPGMSFPTATGHKPYRPKPHGQRLPRVLEYGAGSHRGLAIAVRTLEQGGTNYPRFAKSATRAPKSLRPPQLKEVIATTFFRRKPGLELLQRSRNLPSGDHTTGRGYLSQVHTQNPRYRSSAVIRRYP